MPNDRYVFTKIGYWPHLDVCVDCTIIWLRLRPGAEIRKKKKKKNLANISASPRQHT